MILFRPITVNTWKKLFLFCLGLAIASAFCMKWMERDFIFIDYLGKKNNTFSILGLELFYSRIRVSGIIQSLDFAVLKALQYHLSFDFVFMAAVYPGIAALCIMAREKTESVPMQKKLYVLAILQLVAWIADIVENSYLLHWSSYNPWGANGYDYVAGVQPHLFDLITDTQFAIYHAVVILKWVLALTGLITALVFVLRKRKPGF